jgi:NAD(P)-dependent dehydrogenase (short-subunit alcohol dehydrogenase family)
VEEIDIMPTNPAAQPKVALVIGAGDSTGGAIAKRFAREGYVACVTRRSADKLQPLVDEITAAGGQARGFASDARKEEDVVALIEQIERDIGPIEVLVFNIGANVPCSILEETARKYFKIWEMACFSGFLNAREVAYAGPRSLCAERAGRHPEPRAHCRELLVFAQPAARRLDVRAGPAAVHGKMVRTIVLIAACACPLGGSG